MFVLSTIDAKAAISENSKQLEGRNLAKPEGES